MANHIDITAQRECLFSSFGERPRTCPNCGGTLTKSFQTYVCLTFFREQMLDPLVLGGDFGWFCLACPTVVIDTAAAEEMIADPMGEPIDAYKIMGLVNHQAVPPNKIHVPMGEDDNPIPLIPFLGVE